MVFQAGGRGWYTGVFYGADGTRLASIAQAALFAPHDRAQA
jgi:hypothetical protein